MLGLDHDQRPHAVAGITAIGVTVRTPPLDNSASKRRPYRRTTMARLGPERPTRRQLITAIMTSEPPRPWSGLQLARLLGVKPRNMLTQLGEWTRLGFFTRTDFGTYALNTPSEPDCSTNEPDP